MILLSDVGKVTYKAEVDVGDISKSISEAEKKIENADLGDALSENIEKGAKEASESVKESADSIGKSTEKMKSDSVAKGVAIGNAMTMAGEAALNFAGHMVDVTTDYSSAMSQMQAATGVSSEKMKEYEDIMKSLYTNNYGESFTDISDALSQIRTQIGPVVDSWDPTALESFTESAFALRDTFGYDINETVRASNALMEQFGIDGEKAMNLIASGAQNGLDFSGEFLDSISEYSVQFEKLGLDADDMFKIFQKGADTGAFNLDKVGDAVKELAVRVVDGSDTTAAGFESIGLNADEMSAKFAAGGESAKEAFYQTVEAIASMDDPLAQSQAGVALFGTMWEDLGPDVVNALAEIEDGAYGTSDAMNQLKDVKYDNLSSMLEAITRQVEMLLLPLGEALIPILSEIIEAILPVLEPLLQILSETLMQLIEPILGIIEALTPVIELIISTLMPIIQLLADTFAEVFTEIASVVSQYMAEVVETFTPVMDTINSVLIPVIKGLLSVFKSNFKEITTTIKEFGSSVQTILKGIINFVSGVFTGNWRQAWNGVKQIFSGIVSGLASIFKSPINAIISGINTFINGINRIKIPSWVPGIGGLGFSIPTIPRLKAGIDYVPADFWPAFLDKGEMVLTADEAAAYRSIGGINGLSSASYGKTGAPEIIEVPLYIDGREVARATAWRMGEQLSWEEM